MPYDRHFLVRSGTDRHRRRKFCEAFVFRKTRNASTLLIDGDEQSRISTFDRSLLEFVRERSNLSRDWILRANKTTPPI